ncbi:amidohydrolase family protein [uncultured Marivirga sp.]|uniref:amidohydrolase family protein n=1 Tax=uncultured Marivirga sp. TaxID=1123707 RepID=UPI0030EB8A51|tara:strand:+ start:349637 stop:350515 length:879 start_codon:yes stop_codon:yes gene_type:complete
MKRVLNILIFIPFFSFSQGGNQPIIDMHLHDYTEQTYYTAPAPDGVMSPKDYQTYRFELLKVLHKYNVKKADVSTIGGANKLDKEGIFIPGYYTNSPPEDTIAFRQLIESGELKVFGEIGAAYDGLALSDSKFEPFLKICERYDIPVAVHTGGGPADITYRCCPNFRIKFGDPYLIEDVLAKFPNLRIYMMHAGEVFYENALRLMLQYSQLYTDLGVILWVHEQPKDFAEQFLRNAKKYGLIDRVMFGSDQMVWPHAIEKSINELNSYSFLTEEDKKKIFYDNAVNFLELEE